MNGRQRILALIEGRPTDRLPLMPITMMFAADQIGVAYGRYAADYRVLAEAQIRTAEKFDFDYVSCISDPAREAADCGATVHYFDDQPPAIDESHALLADKKTLARLKAPEPLSGGRMHDRVQAAALLRERAGSERLVEGWIEGPCAESADPAGHQHPDDRFLRRPGLCDGPVRVRRAERPPLRQGPGRGRRRHHRTWRRGRLARRPADLRGVRAALREEADRRPARLGTRVRLHICGNTRRILKGIGQLGCELIDIDGMVPMSQARDEIGPRAILTGNLDPVKALRNSTPEAITAALASAATTPGRDTSWPPAAKSRATPGSQRAGDDGICAIKRVAGSTSPCPGIFNFRPTFTLVAARSASWAPWTARLGRRAILVGYQDRTGLDEAYARAEQSLAKAGIAVARYFEVLPEPGSDLPDRCAEAASADRTDVFVALGGGSVIDVAKAAAALTVSGGRMADYLVTDPAPAPAAALPVVAVPTTAGTGSEVSDVAVFSHGSGKAAMFGAAMRPRLAVVDPELAAGSPASLTAACAADALGHATEACLSRRANPMASLLAGRAVALVVHGLPRAVEEPASAEPRESLALAATLAGAAFTSAGVAGAHALAQALGVVLGIAHGRAVAMALPPMLRFNATACGPQYADLARWCGLPDAAAFIDRVTGLLDSLGLLAKLPPGEGVADRLVAAALAARVPLVQNPVRLDEPALRQIVAQMQT